MVTDLVLRTPKPEQKQGEQERDAQPNVKSSAEPARHAGIVAAEREYRESAAFEPMRCSHGPAGRLRIRMAVSDRPGRWLQVGTARTVLNLSSGDTDEQVVSPTAAMGRDLALGQADQLNDGGPHAGS